MRRQSVRLGSTPRLRTLLLLSNLAVLVLPLSGLWILRLYESALVRQTESELVAQAAVLSAAFREQLRHAEPDQPLPAAERPFPPSAATLDLLRRPGLDLAEDTILPPPPDPVPAPQPAQPLALVVGRALDPVLRDAQAVTLAALRLTDAHGVVVATTGSDLGLSLATWQEVAQVLSGAPVASTMRRRVPAQPVTGGLSRLSNLRVFVALPVQGVSGVAGAVILSRTPRDVESAIWGKRWSLAGLGTLLVTTGSLLAVGLSRRVTRPLQLVVAQAQQAAQGGTFVPLARPGTREVAELSASLTRMASTLEQRASYIIAFAASVSHEFKTPLAALSGAAELLEDSDMDLAPDERERLLGIISGSAARLDRLVRRLLDLARADMIRPTDAVALPLAPTLAEVAERYREQGLSINLVVSDETVSLPRDVLDALLASLLDNVLAHAGPSARVSIVAESRPGQVLITVHDDGVGISSANRDRVFDPFFTTARSAGSTGVGLPIVRAIANGVGGSVELTTTDRGASFVVILPSGVSTLLS